MMYLKTLASFSVIYVSIELVAGFSGLDSAHLIAVVALFLACRSNLLIDELEEKQ